MSPHDRCDATAKTNGLRCLNRWAVVREITTVGVLDHAHVCRLHDTRTLMLYDRPAKREDCRYCQDGDA